MAWRDYKKASRVEWGRELSDGEGINIEEIQLGCLLRIADAAEAIAKNYQKLIADRDMYERWWKSAKAECQRLERQRAALRGRLTRLKREKGEVSHEINV